MSESMGPATKDAIQKFSGGNLPETSKSWGKRALWWILWSVLLLIGGVFGMATWMGSALKGWGVLVLVWPLMYGVPSCIVIGLVLAVVGVLRDEDPRLARIATGLWLAFGAGVLVFVYG